MAHITYDNTPVFDFCVESFGKVSILIIEDLYDPLFPTMTVTNGINAVLEVICQKIQRLPSLIIYRDSEGEWDRIIVEENRFLSFAPIFPGLNKRIIDRQEAIELAVLNYL